MSDSTHRVAVAVPGGGEGGQYVLVPVRDRNGLAVAGFLIALIGLFVPTGLVALLGLLLSMAALTRPPRTLAFFGLLIGLIGCVFWLALTVVALLGGAVAAVGLMVVLALGFVFTQPQTIEVTSDMVNLAAAAAEYEREHQVLPDDLTVLNVERTARLDPWGQPYRLQMDADADAGFDLRSAGPDLTFDTEDDITLATLDRLWEQAFERFGEDMEAFGRKMEALEQLDCGRGGALRRKGCSRAVDRHLLPVRAQQPYRPHERDRSRGEHRLRQLPVGWFAQSTAVGAAAGNPGRSRAGTSPRRPHGPANQYQAS